MTVSRFRARKVLVTGGTGFLGACVARELAQRGHRVTTLSRRPSNAVPFVEWLAGDVQDKDFLARTFGRFDAVVHVAGLVSLKPSDRAELLAVNVEGTRNVLEAAWDAKIRVVHTSSIATLGYRDAPVAVDEGALLHPEDRASSPYAESKWQAERLALQFAASGGEVVVVNPGYLLGPGDSALTSTRVVLQYLRGEVWFFPAGGISFADVRDVAAAYVAALEHGESGSRYALAGKNFSYGELFQALYQLSGVRRPLPAPRAMGVLGAFAAELAAVFVPHPFRDLNLASFRFASRFNYCDVSKAERELGYRSRDFSETLVSTIEDQLVRGLARASTPELEALLEKASERTKRPGRRTPKNQVIDH